MSGSNRLVS